MRLVNGVPSDSIPATDRGFAYGDGVFRTLLAVRGEPVHWPRHYAKLAADCAVLGIPCTPEALLLAETRAVVREQPHSVVKIMITRGSGARGYALPNPCAPLRVVMRMARLPVPDMQAGVTVHLCRLRLAQQPALAGIKHLNRLENIMARMEWVDPAIAEGLLLDQDGLVIGGTMSNLFIVENGELLTPDLSRCGVAGVTRARVIEIAERARMTCSVQHLPLQRILDADAVFLVNSLIGQWPVARLGKRVWRSDEIAAEVRKALEADDADLA